MFTKLLTDSLSNSHRAHFHSCCSAFDQLGAVAAQMPGVEQLFILTACNGGADNQPAVAQSLRYVRGQVEGALTDFTAWKTQLLCLGTLADGECVEPITTRPLLRVRLISVCVYIHACVSVWINRKIHFYFFASSSSQLTHNRPLSPSSLLSWN